MSHGHDAIELLLRCIDLLLKFN